MSSPDSNELLGKLQRLFSPADRERLSRVLERCRVDLQEPLDAIGSGSRITQKRGMALKLALEGADLPTITAMSSLSEARVRQVLANVREYGFEALYPRFSETLPLQKPLDENGLWKAIKEFLGKSPRKAGVSDEKWRPSTVTDYLVHTGTLEDASASRIAGIIGKYKDRKKTEISIGGVEMKSELPFEFKEPSQGGARRLLPFSLWFPFGLLLFGFTFWGGVTKKFINAESGEATSNWQSYLLAAFSVLAIVLLLGLIVKQSLEWWLLQKVLASTQTAGAASISSGQLWKRWLRRDILGLPDASGKVPARSMRGIVVNWAQNNVPFLKKKVEQPQQPGPEIHHVNPMGAPKLTLLNARTLPEARWDIDSITDSRNALGIPPIRTLYLWVFDAQEEQVSVYKEEGWLQLGPVHMLLNATALPLLTLLRKGKELLLKDDASVDRWLAALDDKAGWHPPSGLFGGSLRKAATYLGYPLHAPLCSDGSWEHALHSLAARCDLAVVNLSGYDPTHPGLAYELRHLLSGGPPHKFVFTYDYYTDADAVIESVLAVWKGMETNGPAPELVFMRTLRANRDPFQVVNPYDAQFLLRQEKRESLRKLYNERAAEFVPVASRLVSYLVGSGRFAGKETRELQAGD